MTSVNSCEVKNLVLGSKKLPVIVFDVTFNQEIIPASMARSDRVAYIPSGIEQYTSLINPAWIVIGGYCFDGQDTTTDINQQVLSDFEKNATLSQSFASYGTTKYSGISFAYQTGGRTHNTGGGGATGILNMPNKAPMVFITSNGKLHMPNYSPLRFNGGSDVIGQIEGFRSFSCSYESVSWNYQGYYNWGSYGWPIVDVEGWFEDIPKDPYAAGGTSEPSQATGNFDLSSDSVDFPALPTLTSVSTGLVTIYTPNLQQINALATYLWNADPTTVDWWKKLVANPLDLILGLSIVPVAVPTSGAESVKVGLIDTQVSMNKASTQFVEVPCGSINITEFYGGALDYAPYRKTSIYLPFIGTRLISTDDIMGKTVEVKYHVDLLSGALVALVKCGDAVLYQFAGACAVSLPLSGQTFTDTILSTIQLAAAGTAFVATGGFGLTGGAAVAAAAGGGAALAGNVMTSKPQIERAGGVSGAAGQLGIMTPYLIGEIPRQSVPENYNTFVGYPSNIKATLGDLTGFTSVESIHLQNIPATAAEYAEIEQLLKEGVIL